MNGRVGEVRNLMEEPMSHLFGDGVSLGHAQMRINAHGQLSEDVMPSPAGSEIVHVADSFTPHGDVTNCAKNLRVDGVHEAVNHLWPALQEYSKYRH